MYFKRKHVSERRKKEGGRERERSGEGGMEEGWEIKRDKETKRPTKKRRSPIGEPHPSQARRVGPLRTSIPVTRTHTHAHAHTHTRTHTFTHTHAHNHAHT